MFNYNIYIYFFVLFLIIKQYISITIIIIVLLLMYCTPLYDLGCIHEDAICTIAIILSLFYI